MRIVLLVVTVTYYRLFVTLPASKSVCKLQLPLTPPPAIQINVLAPITAGFPAATPGLTIEGLELAAQSL